MRQALLVLACLTIATASARSEGPPPLPPPLPPIRPPELANPPTPPPLPGPPPLPPTPSQSAEPAAACLARLGAEGVKAEAVPAPQASLADCSIATPVRLTSITIAPGATLDFPDRPTLDCEFAAVFADYARNLMMPLARSMLGSPIVALSTGPGYQCRGRNGVFGAKTSAHGKGIAIDLVSITLADRRRIEIAHQKEESETRFVAAIRKAGCGWFTTVLGPGSDAAHATHMHVDILRHGSSQNYRICE
jgi:hypothetical protein